MADLTQEAPAEDPGPMSFDEISGEGGQTTAPAEIAAEPEEETEEVAEEVEEETEEVEEVAEAMEEGEAVTMPEEKSLPGKNFTGTSVGGEKEDVHSGTFITIPVNGEQQKVQIQELINNYAGKVAYDKKFSSLHTERQEFGQKQEMLNSHLTKIFKKAEDLATSESGEDKRSAAMDVLRLFGQLTGGDSYSLVTSLRNAFIDEASSLGDMDEIDRKRYEFDLERGFHDKLEKEKTDRSAQAAQYADYSKQSDEITQAYAIDKQEFMDVKSQLEELFSSGKIQGEVTPARVLEYRSAKVVHAALSENHPELVNDDKLFNRLVDYALEDKLSKEDLIALIDEASGQSQKSDERTKRINRKVKGKVKAKLKPKPKAKEPEVRFSNSSSMWDDV